MSLGTGNHDRAGVCASLGVARLSGPILHGCGDLGNRLAFRNSVADDFRDANACVLVHAIGRASRQPNGLACGVCVEFRRSRREVRSLCRHLFDGLHADFNALLERGREIWLHCAGDFLLPSVSAKHGRDFRRQFRRSDGRGFDFLEDFGDLLAENLINGRRDGGFVFGDGKKLRRHGL